MDVPYITPAGLNDIQSIQAGIREMVDPVAEALRRQQEIGYTIDQYPAQGSSQPR